MLPFGAPGSPLPTPYCWEYEIFIDSTRSLLNDNQQEVCHAVDLTISPGILCFGCSAEVAHGHSCCVVHKQSVAHFEKTLKMPL